MIYLVTVNYYSAALIADLLTSIRANVEVPYQVVVVNNSPDDLALSTLAATDVVVLESGQNLGFGQACNLALNRIFQQQPQAIVWLVNPDVQVPTDALNRVTAFFASHPSLSIVGTWVIEPSGTVWFARGRFIPATGTILTETTWPDYVSNQDSDYSASDWITGCSMLLNLSQFQTCPQFDPAYFLYYEDFDFCRRYAQAGHSVGVARSIAVVHTPSSITNRNPFLKLSYSTDSYLLTLHRYSSSTVFILRLLRIMLYSFLLLPIKPQTALGKLNGLWMYYKRGLTRDPSPIG